MQQNVAEWCTKRVEEKLVRIALREVHGKGANARAYPEIEEYARPAEAGKKLNGEADVKLLRGRLLWSGGGLRLEERW